MAEDLISYDSGPTNVFSEQALAPPASLTMSPDEPDTSDMVQLPDALSAPSGFDYGSPFSGGAQPLFENLHSEWFSTSNNFTAGDITLQSDDNALTGALEASFNTSIDFFVWRNREAQICVEKEMMVRKQQIELDKRRSAYRVQMCEIRLKRLKAGLEPKPSETH